MMDKQTFFTKYNKNSIQNTQKNEGALLDIYIRRYIAHHIGYFMADRKITPNTATVLFLVFGLLANLLLIPQNIVVNCISLLLYEFSDIFDVIDGQLAKYFGSASINGGILDIFIHTIINSTFLIAIGLKIYLLKPDNIILLTALVGGVAYTTDTLWLFLADQKSENNDHTLKEESGFINTLRLIYIRLNVSWLIPMIIILIMNFHMKYDVFIILKYFYILYVAVLLTVKVAYRMLFLLDSIALKDK